MDGKLPPVVLTSKKKLDTNRRDKVTYLSRVNLVERGRREIR